MFWIYVNCNLEPKENLNLNVVLLCQAITKDMFDEALRALADEDYLTVTGKNCPASVNARCAWLLPTLLLLALSYSLFL